MLRKLLSNRKIFYSVIVVLTLLFGVFSFLTIKSYSNKEEPKSKEKVLERETFTTYISDGNGHYKKYTSADGSLYPSGYVYNQGISYCEDLDGNRLDIVPTYSNNKFTLESDKTVFCYLYFDIELTSAEELIASGELWQSGLEGDGYRYTGSGNYDSATTSSNFICFGTSDKTECKNNEAKYMYRIIGVFEGSDGEQHLKLIKFKQLEKYLWNADWQTDVAWENSDMYAGLNGSYFLSNSTYDYLQNSTWLNKIEDWTWSAVNTKTWSDSGPNYYNSLTPSQIYLHEMNRSSKTSTIGEWSTPVAKIGLMYASDYALSLGDTALAMTTGTYTNSSTLKTGWIHPSNNDTSKGTWEWTLSRFGAYGNGFFAWYVGSDGYVYNDTVGNVSGVRPVFHLTSDARINGGNGEYSNPYVLE